MSSSPFAPYPINEALLISETIVKHNSGKPMRRLTIFDILGKSPTSGPSRSLVTASSGYGLTQGSYNAEIISLLDRGRKIVTENDPKAMIDAVLGVEIFKQFFDNYRNSTVPSNSAAIDFLKAHGIAVGSAQNCLEVLLKSGEYVALIQEISGVKRIVSVDHALEKLSQSGGVRPMAVPMEKAGEISLPRDNGVGEEAPKTGQIDNNNNQLPSIHIDIQIHISSDSKSEQIDQVFASMAKHLYPSRNPANGQ